jgi:hypothetical protein
LGRVIPDFLIGDRCLYLNSILGVGCADLTHIKEKMGHLKNRRKLMRYTTTDGKQFDCELKALRHENDLLVAKVNRLREYGNAAQPMGFKLDPSIIERMRNVANSLNTQGIAMDTDSFMMFKECSKEKGPEMEFDYTEIPTGFLVEEIGKREGVKDLFIAPGEYIHLITEGIDQLDLTGPVRLLIVED